MVKDKDKDMVKEMVKEKTESLNFPFSSETFLNQWDILVKMKKWKSKPHSALQASLNKLSRYCEFDAIRMIENAIAGNWMGFVELKPHEISKPQMSKIEKGMQDIEDSKPLIAKIFSDEPNS